MRRRSLARFALAPAAALPALPETEPPVIDAEWTVVRSTTVPLVDPRCLDTPKVDLGLFGGPGFAWDMEYGTVFDINEGTVIGTGAMMLDDALAAVREWMEE